MPVGLEHRDVLQPQQHVRMITEGRAGHRVVVLRADGEQDAPRLEPAGDPLHRQECLARRVARSEDEPLDAIVLCCVSVAAVQTGLRLSHQCVIDQG